MKSWVQLSFLNRNSRFVNFKDKIFLYLLIMCECVKLWHGSHLLYASLKLIVICTELKTKNLYYHGTIYEVLHNLHKYSLQDFFLQDYFFGGKSSFGTTISWMIENLHIQQNLDKKFSLRRTSYPVCISNLNFTCAYIRIYYIQTIIWKV